MRRLALVLLIAMLGIAGAVMVPSARAAGPTYVSGEVSGTWVLDGSPYIVTGEAFIPALGSLDIAPGVEVRFASGTSLVVNGGLVVRGSDLAPVAFTSNGSAVSGSWGGLVVRGTAAITSASLTYSSKGLDVEGGSVQVDRLSVLHSTLGLLVNGSSSAIIGRSSFALNEIAGAKAVSSTVAMDRVEFSSNGWALVLIASRVTLDNGTLNGSALGDADLTGSSLTLRDTPSSHVFQFHDVESSVTERWFASVHVTDAFGSAVPMANVNVSGGGLPTPILRTTDLEGWARWIDLPGRVSSNTGSTVPTYDFSSAVGDAHTSRTSTILGDTAITMALPADLTPPVAVAGPDITAPEDTGVTLDGSGSRDNNPSFPFGATFTWQFDDGGTPTVLSGEIVTYTFATPGTFSIVLDVTDAAGNSGSDVMTARVADTTPPVARISIPTQAYAADVIVLDGRGSSDNDPSFNETGNYTWTLESAATTGTLYGPAPTFSGGVGDYVVTLRVRDEGGNEAVATAALRIVANPTFDPLWLVGAVVAWFAALGIAGTERGRMAFLSWFVLPLYSRLKKDEVLDQFTRGQIYGYIVVHPGDSYIDIKRNLQLNNGTLTHHLSVLERDGLVRSKNVGTRKLFFAKGARVPEDGGGMHEVQQQILKHLQESGGLAVSDVAGVIGISRQLAIYHLRDLSRRGLVRIERRAFRIVAYAEEPEPPPPP